MPAVHPPTCEEILGHLGLRKHQLPARPGAGRHEVVVVPGRFRLTRSDDAGPGGGVCGVDGWGGGRAVGALIHKQLACARQEESAESVALCGWAV